MWSGHRLSLSLSHHNVFCACLFSFPRRCVFRCSVSSSPCLLLWAFAATEGRSLVVTLFAWACDLGGAAFVYNVVLRRAVCALVLLREIRVLSQSHSYLLLSLFLFRNALLSNAFLV